MVINRQEIKSNAWESIKNSKPSPFLATTVILLLNGIISQITGIGQDKEIGILVVLGLILSIVFSFISVGYQWYCLNVSRNQSPDPITVLEIFSSEKFVKVIKVWILVYIKTFLWSLLFIIPGIIKSYAYSQSYYVLYDNPNYTASQCIDESQRLMKGNKLELFLFQLSFIGWALLSVFATGIVTAILSIFLPTSISFVVSILLMVPIQTYLQVSTANFYNTLYMEGYRQY